MGKLGDTLNERRAALGLTIDQVHKATRIRESMIRALEDGDYSHLPNPGYVRGYISSYARLLGLDPLPLLAMYKAETGAGRFHELNLPQQETAVVPTGQQHALPWRAALAIVLVLALVTTSVWLVARLWRGPEPTAPVPTAVTEPGETSETTQPATVATTTTEAVAPTPDPVSEVESFTLKVVVDSDGASWVEVKVDGKKAYVGTMTGGQSKTFEVSDEASVLVGKPSVVTVTRDGKKVEYPKSQNTPVITLKADTAE